MITQHQFHPTRKWRFDFAHKETLTAIEIQGFGRGHTSYNGMASDYEKHNEAVRYGWIIIYLMSHDVAIRSITKTVKYVEEIINARPLSTQKILRPILPRSSYEETINKLLDQ